MPGSFFAGSCNPPDPPDFHWERLERASGLTFTESQRTALVGTMHRYLRYLEMQRAAAETKDVRRRLEGIHRHASALVDLLRLHIKNAPSDDYEINLNQAVWGSLDINIDPNIYIRLLIQLRLAGTKALTRLREEGQPGREDKTALDTTIRAWHDVYTQAGGVGRGCTRSGGSSQAKGPFLDLIDGAFQQLLASQRDSPLQHDIPPNRDALAQRILIALKRRRPARGTG
jgi:hypothetical protein